MAPSLPADWREIQSPDYITEKYRARNPTLFVSEAHSVGVHVLPASTSSPHEDEHYRVGAIRGNEDEFEYERELGDFDDRERAFERALEFANRYNAEYEAHGDETDALESAVENVA